LRSGDEASTEAVMEESPSKQPPAAEIGWKDRAGRAWVALVEQTDAQLDPLGRLAMERLALGGGDRVIDVGCGCGQTLLQLAAAVGPSGRVLGADVSEVMVADARERVARAGVTNVALICDDVQTHAFEPRGHDAVFSRFGVMFFSQPRAAFENLRAAVKPSGRLSFVCWQALDLNAWARIPLRAAQAEAPSAALPPFLSQPGDDAGEPPGPFSFANPDRVRDLLTGAGFRDLAIEPLALPLQVGGAQTLDQATSYLMQIGPAARLISDLDPQLRPTLQAAISRAVAPFAGPRGVWMDAALFVVTARA
jgi:SAM-dependent methyltransferase